MSITTYPLAWPVGWPRTPLAERDRARFGVRRPHEPGGYRWKQALSIADGVTRLRNALKRLGVEEHTIVISTNCVTRNDGLPRSGAREPNDPGVAVYWTLDGDQECIAIDAYNRLADNLAAIAATIEAMRAIERHGGAQILRRAFVGFKALPASTGATMGVEAAWATLHRFVGLGSGEPDPSIRSAAAKDWTRTARHRTHPDRNGDAGNFQLVQRAAETLSAHYLELSTDGSTRRSLARCLCCERIIDENGHCGCWFRRMPEWLLSVLPRWWLPRIDRRHGYVKNGRVWFPCPTCGGDSPVGGVVCVPCSRRRSRSAK